MGIFLFYITGFIINFVGLNILNRKQYVEFNDHEIVIIGMLSWMGTVITLFGLIFVGTISTLKNLQELLDRHIGVGRDKFIRDFLYEMSSNFNSSTQSLDFYIADKKLTIIVSSPSSAKDPYGTMQKREHVVPLKFIGNKEKFTEYIKESIPEYFL